MTTERRIGLAVKVLGRGGLPSHDTRRWQSGPNVLVSIERLRRILEYLRAEDIRMYRMSSDFVPYATHPNLPQFHGQIDQNAQALADIGRVATEYDVRLSLHPSQYVVLNAVDDTIARAAAADLDSQARLLDAMGQGAEAVVVLHLGGVYGDRQASLDRFVRNVERLPEPARRRLVIENGEMCYSIPDCMWVHQRTGLPIVFDHHHHRLNHGGMTAEEAARAALDTWPADVTPKVHFSSPRLDGRVVGRGREARLQAPLLRQHADYIDPWTFADLLQGIHDRRFDVMLEAKAKDLALLKLRADLRMLGGTRLLAQPRA
jgi:UV DNA damage endonuclease